MLRRILSIYLSLLTLPCLVHSSAWAKNPPVTGSPLTVSIYNEAGLASAALAEAERAASSIFHDAGIDVTWLNCGDPHELSAASTSCRETVAPTHLQLRILKRSAGLSESAFGVSYLNTDGGCYSDIFLEPIQELRAHEGFQVDLGIMLGTVAAHEIGHLLLGVNSHSPSGIMRPHWHYDDLSATRRRTMVFTDEQGQAMRSRLAATPTTTHTQPSAPPTAPSGF